MFGRPVQIAGRDAPGVGSIGDSNKGIGGRRDVVCRVVVGCPSQTSIVDPGFIVGDCRRLRGGRSPNHIGLFAGGTTVSQRVGWCVRRAGFSKALTCGVETVIDPGKVGLFTLKGCKRAAAGIQVKPGRHDGRTSIGGIGSVVAALPLLVVATT